MEQFKKYVTQKNVCIGSIVSGIVALVLYFIYLMITGAKIESISHISGLISKIQMICNLFYLNIFVLIVVVAASGYRIFAMKDASLCTKIVFGTKAGALLLALFSYGTVSAIKSAISGNLGSMYSLGESNMNMNNASTFLVLMLLAQLVGAGVAIYFMFIKKEVSDHEEVTEGASTTNPSMTKAVEQAKAYYATEKGKKNVRLAGIIAIALVVVLVGFNVYASMKRTSIDLTSSCEVKFSGVSGEGYAEVDCAPDYDRTDSKITIFINGINYKVENNYKLQNGDMAVITAEYSEATADSSKVKVENATKEVLVEGLEIIYKTYAEVPAERVKEIELAAKQSLEKNVNKTSETSSMFSPTSVKLNQADLIGTYYTYSTSQKYGKIHYVYRTKVTETYSSRIEENYEYYEVAISQISSTQDATKLDTFSSVNRISMYGDDKSDEKAIKSFRSYKSNIEVVQENLSSETYTDTSSEIE